MLNATKHTNLQWEMQTKYIPGGSQTVSKQPERFGNMYPKLIKLALGSTIEDIDGNTYTDYISALGPIILGYANRQVDKAVKDQMAKGTIFSLPSIEEYGLAMQLNQIIPCAEKSRFFKTGSDATSAAVKVARAVTGKERVLSCGYHGWHDWYTVTTDNKRGIPKRMEGLVEKFMYDSVDSLREKFHTDDVACVIMEPFQFKEPTPGYLDAVKQLCHEHGALLIFDEIITGFRFHIGGIQSYYKVVPDLATFSKAMGNGYPIAALCGKAEYMDVFDSPGFFISGTFGGDLIGIAAAKTTIYELQRNDQLAIKHLWKAGNSLKDGFNGIVEGKGLPDTYCEGLGPRTRFVFPSLEHKALFYQEAIKNGLMFGPNNFIQLGHTTSIVEYTLMVIDRITDFMKENWQDPKKVIESDTLPKEVVIR